jgi:uncharacterized protein YbdZ (MbtH family)
VSELPCGRHFSPDPAQNGPPAIPPDALFAAHGDTVESLESSPPRLRRWRSVAAVRPLALPRGKELHGDDCGWRTVVRISADHDERSRNLIQGRRDRKVSLRTLRRPTKRFPVVPLAAWRRAALLTGCQGWLVTEAENARREESCTGKATMYHEIRRLIRVVMPHHRRCHDAFSARVSRAGQASCWRGLFEPPGGWRTTGGGERSRNLLCIESVGHGVRHGPGLSESRQ